MDVSHLGLLLYCIETLHCLKSQYDVVNYSQSVTENIGDLKK